MFSGPPDQCLAMIHRKRKKKPPDPSPSLFDLNLCPNRAPILFSGLLFLPVPNLGSHVPAGTRSSVTTSIPNYLSSPASLYLELPASICPVRFPSLSDRCSVWRVMMLTQLNIGVSAPDLEASICLFALLVRSVYPEVDSTGLLSPSGLGSFWGQRGDAYVSIVQLVPVLVRLRVLILLGASILKIAHRIDPFTGHLRRIASRSALGASYCHNWPDRSVCIASCGLLALSQSQVSYSLSLLFFLVLMDFFWPLHLYALQSISSQFRVWWTGVPRFTWPWSSLRIIWLVDVAVLAATESWLCPLHTGTSHVFTVDTLVSPYFPVGVSLLFLRCLLYYPYCLNITLYCFDLPGGCGPWLQLNVFLDYLCWIFVNLVHYTLRLLIVMNCANSFSFQPLPWRPHSKNCLGQHVNMLRLPLWMFDQPILGGWNILCLIFYPVSECFLAEKLANIFAYPLSWLSSYPLLSLSQACKHAHEHVLLFTCCCWHLDPLPRLRDEVKEEYPSVYDDNFSETHYFCLLSCLPPLLCCYISDHLKHLSVSDLWAEQRTTL